MDVKKIINAWITSINPTHKQKELAELRKQICKTCSFRKRKFSVYYCSDCGCPIEKKIYDNNYNACSVGKWKQADMNFFPIQKSKRTII